MNPSAGKVVLPYRIGIQQRVFPAYRAPFFDALAQVCAGGLSVFAGEPLPDEALGQEGELKIAQRVQARNHYLGWGPLLLVWQAKIIDWLDRWQPDGLVTDTNPRNASTVAAIHWMHARKRPVIGWGLGAPPYPDRWYYRPLEASRRRFLKQFDAIISYSETGIQQYQRSGVPRERAFIAPNAVTLRPASPPQRPPNFEGRRPVALFVGRLQERKRVDALLQACAALPEPIRPALKIVGDGPARAFYQAAAQHVYPQAEFLGDRRGVELDALFAGADLFVLPGTGGLAVQQAMSFALPVIVAEADGTQSDLVRRENGWLLPAQDDSALANALQEALSDPARLRRMGLESYRIVADEVNIERMVAVFAEVIRLCSSS